MHSTTIYSPRLANTRKFSAIREKPIALIVTGSTSLMMLTFTFSLGSLSLLLPASCLVFTGQTTSLSKADWRPAKRRSSLLDKNVVGRRREGLKDKPPANNAPTKKLISRRERASVAIVAEFYTRLALSSVKTGSAHRVCSLRTVRTTCGTYVRT